jgi:hypothetical protein
VDESTADNSFDVDIVERALAILDEESRTWVMGQQSLPEAAEGNPDA